MGFRGFRNSILNQAASLFLIGLSGTAYGVVGLFLGLRVIRSSLQCSLDGSVRVSKMGSRRGDIQHSMLQVLQKVTSSLGGL